MSLTPIPEESFDGEKEVVELKHEPHTHFFVRFRTPVGLGIRCNHCNIGLIDNGQIRLVNGQIDS